MEATAPAHPSLAAALAAAQGELQDPLRTKTGQVGRAKYMYASIDDLLAVVRPALSAHGVAFSQTLDMVGERVVLRTRLWVDGGDEMTSVYPLTWKGTPQDHGSEISYARRYSLEAIVGVAATPDDDGQSASHTPARSAARPQPQPQPQTRPAAKPPQLSIEEFEAAIRGAGLDLDEVVWLCATHTRIKTAPAEMTPQDRASVRDYLISTKGRAKLEAMVKAERVRLQGVFFAHWSKAYPEPRLKDGAQPEEIERAKAVSEADRRRVLQAWYGVDSIWKIPLTQVVAGPRSTLWLRNSDQPTFEAAVVETLKEAADVA